MQDEVYFGEEDSPDQVEALIETSALKEIIDKIDHGVVVTDLNGNIIYINEHFSAIHGYRPEELITKHLSIFHTEDQMITVNKMLNELKEKGSVKSHRIWHKRKDGNIFPTIMSGIIIKNKNGQPQFIYINASDTSIKRKIRQKFLKARYDLDIRNRIANAFLTSSEDELYENVINIIKKVLQSEHGIFCCVDEYGNIINPSISKYLWGEYGLENTDYHSKDETVWEKAITEKKTIILNGNLNIPNGHVAITRFIIVPIIYHENVIGIIALANKPEDYNEQDKELIESIANYVAPILDAKMQRDKQELARKKAEKALIEKEELYRSAIETAGAIPYCRNFETNSYEFIGDRIKDLTGYSKEEFTPNIFESIIIEKVLYGKYAGLSFEIAIEKARKEKESSWWLDIRIKTRDGEEKWLMDTSVQIRDNEGNLIKTIGIIQDITDRKLTEKKLQESNRLLEETLSELRKTQQQIIQQERLRALGQLASGIAHDFNNALMPIMGYSDLLLNVPNILNDLEKVKKYLELIRTSSEDAKDVVDRLRSFYKTQPDKEAFIKVDLNNIIHQVVNLTKPKWKDQSLSNGVTIDILTDLNDIPYINGVESELREALTNLILNSVDAIKLNGVIILRTYCDGDKVTVNVIDNGCGMTDDVLSRCFDPFFSTKGEDGTGLGLSVVYGVIQRHKGSIDVKSKPGEGTTFTLSFPALKDDIKERKDQKTTDVYLKPLHILVVDDDPIVREIIGEFLERDGYTYEFSNNGREGLTKFKSNKFDLVITDKAMPDISGDQLASILREISPQTPIIMLTGFGSIMSSAGEMPDAIDCLLSKPLKLQDFRNAIRDVMEKNVAK